MLTTVDPNKYWQRLGSIAWSLNIELRASQHYNVASKPQEVLQRDSPRSHSSGSGTELALIQPKSSEGKWRHTPLLE